MFTHRLTSIKDIPADCKDMPVLRIYHDCKYGGSGIYREFVVGAYRDSDTGVFVAVKVGDSIEQFKIVQDKGAVSYIGEMTGLMLQAFDCAGDDASFYLRGQQFSRLSGEQVRKVVYRWPVWTVGDKSDVPLDASMFRRSAFESPLTMLALRADQEEIVEGMPALEEDDYVFESQR